MSKMRLAASGLAVALALASTGCTHVQLRKNTTRQAGTLSDIYQQQVLDNLAMFVYDYNSLPHFAFAKEGSSQVSDTGGAEGGVGWSALGFDSASLGFNGQRVAEEAWTLTPISDPRILELMRCAYQRAAASCLPGAAESAHCPACEKRFRDYYTGSPDGKLPAPGNPEDTGIITSECLRADCCWFQIGCKRCVPKHSACCRIGHYCGVYVWVPPGRGQEELTKLTLAILDYATNEPAKLEGPAPEPTKEVVLYLDAEGRPTNEANAARVIKATRPASEDDLSLLKPYLPQLTRSLRQLETELQAAPTPKAAETTKHEIARLTREIQAIQAAPMPRAMAAPEALAPGAAVLPRREPRYYPSSPLDLRQQLRALAPSR